MLSELRVLLLFEIALCCKVAACFRSPVQVLFISVERLYEYHKAKSYLYVSKHSQIPNYIVEVQIYKLLK